MGRAHAIGVVAALALALGLGWGEVPKEPGPRPNGVALYRSTTPSVRSSPTGFAGGVVTASTGEQVRIEISSSYAPDAVSAQAWADFFAGLVHGPELSALTVRIAPPAEVSSECGGSALACYAGGLLVMPGEPSRGIPPEDLARHEYGHHVAANRSNPPWRASDYGPKHWASAADVCAREAAGTAFPNNYFRYGLHPGEAFAEAYRVLDERRSGRLALTWGIVDSSFIPDAGDLRAVERDVLAPWTRPSTTRLSGRFLAGAPRRRLLRLQVPLDGELTVQLRLPPGRLDTLELLAADGRALARGLWAGRSTRRLSYLVCGERTLALRVTCVGAPGRFDVTVSRP